MSARQTPGLLCVIGVLCVLVGSCVADDRENKAASGQGGLGPDKPLAAYQDRLLEQAFEIASAIPNNPHIKPKSRAQTNIVNACLELDQPNRALRYIERIGNWRRGLGYANLALHCVRHGYQTDIQDYLDKATMFSELATQAWRVDQVRVRIAQTRILLRERDPDPELDESLEESERGKLIGFGTPVDDDESFQRVMDVLDEMVATKNFDLTINAMRAYARLFDRWYENAERRELIEKKLRTAWATTPPLIRIDLLHNLTISAVDHDDQTKALELVDEAQDLMEGVRWPVRYHVPVMADLAGLRFRAGDPEGARPLVESALELFRSRHEDIPSFERAETLRPVAVAYRTMGDTDTALAVYRQVIEQGAINANAKQRAVDLAATLGSMALHAVEPDEQLWTRIHEIREGLGEPW